MRQIFKDAENRMKWRHGNLRYDLYIVGQVVVYFERLTIDDLSRYLNKIKSIGFRKA